MYSYVGKVNANFWYNPILIPPYLIGNRKDYKVEVYNISDLYPLFVLEEEAKAIKNHNNYLLLLSDNDKVIYKFPTLEKGQIHIENVQIVPVVLDDNFIFFKYKQHENEGILKYNFLERKIENIFKNSIGGRITSDNLRLFLNHKEGLFSKILKCLTKEAGELVWEFNVDTAKEGIKPEDEAFHFIKDLIVTDGVLAVKLSNGKFFGINIETGEQVWERGKISSPKYGGNKVIYNLNALFYEEIDCHTGNTLKHINLDEQ